MKNFKILDCTLRDGGYYTNCDFKPQTVDKYLKATENKQTKDKERSCHMLVYSRQASVKGRASRHTM